MKDDKSYTAYSIGRAILRLDPSYDNLQGVVDHICKFARDHGIGDDSRQFNTENTSYRVYWIPVCNFIDLVRGMDLPFNPTQLEKELTDQGCVNISKIDDVETYIDDELYID